MRLGSDEAALWSKGVEFSVTVVAPGLWKWQFRIGNRAVAGKTEAKLYLLAVRRVQLRIDRELKKPVSGQLAPSRHLPE